MKGIKYVAEIGLNSLNPIKIVEEIKQSDILTSHLKTADYLIGRYKTNYVLIHSKLGDFEVWKVIDETQYLELKKTLSNYYNLRPNTDNTAYSFYLSKKDSLLGGRKITRQGVKAEHLRNLAYIVNPHILESRSSYEKVSDLRQVFCIVDEVISNLEPLIHKNKEILTTNLEWFNLIESYLSFQGYLNSKSLKGYCYFVDELDELESIPEVDLDHIVEVKGAKVLFGFRTIGFILTEDLKLEVAYCILTKEKAKSLSDLPFIRKLNQGYYLP